MRETVQKENKDYDILIKQLYLYYDMKLVTFGIDDKRNLIVQFPVFVHPQNQQHLTLYNSGTNYRQKRKCTIICLFTGY